MGENVDVSQLAKVTGGSAEHVQEHKDLVQLRSTRDRGGDPRGIAAIRAQAERIHRPSKANEAAFARAVDDISIVARVLIDSLVTSAEPRYREVEAERVRAKTLARFGPRG